MMRLIRITAMAALAGTMASAAQADSTNGYGVATTGRANNVYTQVGAVSHYRTGQDSSFNYTRPSDNSTSAYVGCGSYPEGVICSGSATGTNSSDNNLVASSNYANFTDNVGYDVNGFAYGEAWGRASLVSGELGVHAYSDIYRSVLSGPTFIGAQSYAQLNDLLTFTVAGADASTITNIGVSFRLDGSTLTDQSRGNASITENLHFGNGNAHYFFFDSPGESSDNRGYNDRGWVSSVWDFSRPGEVTFSGVYAMSGVSSLIGIYNELLANAGGGASANFGSTSHLSLTLPTNVSFTSASSVFLTQSTDTGAVPEPATWAMMLIGFGLIGAALRRRPARALVAA